MAGPLVNKMVARNVPATKGVPAKIRNYLSLTKNWVHEDQWFPSVWDSQVKAAGTVGEAISAREAWMIPKTGGKKNNTLVIPDLNELSSSHSASVARFVGRASELQNLNDMISGPHGTSSFINAEGMKNWDATQASKMKTALNLSMLQTERAGRKAEGFVKNPIFRALKQGQDLYRLSNPATMMKMASSSHLIIPFLNERSSWVKAMMTPSMGAVASRHFRANTYQYSRGERLVVADVGDTHSATRGKTTLQGGGGPISALRHIPAMADRIAMRTIFTAAAYDLLPAGTPKTAASLDAKKGDIAYWRKVSDKANRMTMETQPTYESFMRSDLLNRGDFVSIILTRYGTQRNRMLNMLAVAQAESQFVDGDASRKKFERTAMSVLGTNALLLSSIAAGNAAFTVAMKAAVRDDDDEMLFAFEKDAEGRSTGKRAAIAAGKKFGMSALFAPLQLLEGGDEAVRALEAAYGAMTGEKHLEERLLRGQFAAGEVKALLDVLGSAGTMARQKEKMDNATSASSYMTAKRSYAYSSGKLYKSMSQLIGVGLHLPTRVLDVLANPADRIRKAQYER